MIYDKDRRGIISGDALTMNSMTIKKVINANISVLPIEVTNDAAITKLHIALIKLWKYMLILIDDACVHPIIITSFVEATNDRSPDIPYSANTISAHAKALALDIRPYPNYYIQRVKMANSDDLRHRYNYSPETSSAFGLYFAMTITQLWPIICNSQQYKEVTSFPSMCNTGLLIHYENDHIHIEINNYKRMILLSMNDGNYNRYERDAMSNMMLPNPMENIDIGKYNDAIKQIKYKYANSRFKRIYMTDSFYDKLIDTNNKSALCKLSKEVFFS